MTEDTFTYIFTVLFWGAILFFIIRRRIRKRRAEFSIIRCHICGKSDCRHIRKAKKARKIAEKAKKISAKNPDKAIALLQKSHKMQKKLQISPYVLLNLRLEQITILYNSDHIMEAEQKLWEEFSYRQNYILTAEDYAKADDEYFHRMDFLEKQKKIFHEKIKDFEHYRNLGEYADFCRNLYFLRIYEKMATLYRKKKDFIWVVIWEVLKEYSHQENNSHMNFSDWHNQEDEKILFEKLFNFSKVETALKKIKKEDYLPHIKEITHKHFRIDPSQDRCWQLYEDLTTYMEKI